MIIHECVEYVKDPSAVLTILLVYLSGVQAWNQMLPRPPLDVCSVSAGTRPAVNNKTSVYLHYCWPAL